MSCSRTEDLLPIKLPRFKQHTQNNNQAALLIHGGCFTQGDETWNKEQAKGIGEHCGLDVFTLDFDKSSLPASLKDIKNLFLNLFETYKERVGLIGCSSGGFLALNVLKEIEFIPKFVVLVCPAIDPTQREDMLLSLGGANGKTIQQHQLTYFKSKPYPKPNYTRTSLHIIAAKEDENVPYDLIVSESKRYPHCTLYTVEGTHNHSYKNSESVNTIIHDVVSLDAAKKIKCNFQQR